MQFTELRYQDPATKTYLGSPSIVRLGSGALLATHDYFGPGCPLNHEGEEHLTSVYRSLDDGRSWTNVTHVAGAFWGNLFTHRGTVYLLSASQQYGSIVIRRSDDDGNTWTHPHDTTTGLLFAGGPCHEPPNYHCAPMPMVFANGRIYRAFEDCDPCEWGTGFRALVISADEDADLIRADAWRMSNKLAFDPAWLPADWPELPRPGWLEGNVAQMPDGSLCDVLRFNSTPRVDVGAVVRISPDGRTVSFDPTDGFIHMPGGMTKFSIRRDPVTGLYLALCNNNTVPECPAQRNVLSLFASHDVRSWFHVRTLVEDDSPLPAEHSLRLVGFQYVDWQFDDDDIIYLVRTAYGGAHSYHDSNRITFHRLRDYAGLLR